VAGNREHGKTLFKANGCAGCHVVDGEGSAYGPELSDIGARRSVAFLKESIVEPGASVPEGFAMVRATLQGGKIVTGVRVNEDSFTIQIRDAAGKFYSFRKQDLADLQKDFGKSPMPAYRGKLSDADLDDLVAWLASLRGKS
jgi:putative heme-binding domain-containing protein